MIHNLSKQMSWVESVLASKRLKTIRLLPLILATVEATEQAHLLALSVTKLTDTPIFLNHPNFWSVSKVDPDLADLLKDYMRVVCAQSAVQAASRWHIP